MTEADHKKSIYLASLLHDLGKFWQRADFSAKGKHSLLSAKYVATQMGDEKIALYTRYHHQADLDAAIKKGEVDGQDALFAQMVCLADTLSSMVERDDFEMIVDEEGKKRMSVEQRTAWSLKAQHCIFNKVHLRAPDEPRPVLYQPVCNLTHDYYEFVHIDEDKQTRPLFREGYEKKWAEFQEEFNKEISDDGPRNLTTIYYLLKKYLWCIPSSYYSNRPDISLFEHSRLAAAIAVCMYDYWLEKTEGDWSGVAPLAVKQSDDPCYLLLVADLSGIQDFLYNIAHTGALRALKGRSYFLQHLMDATARQIIKRIGLFEANLIYSSGGKFYILAPNTSKARNAISEVEEEINAHLLKTYHGALGMVFASMTLSRLDFRRGEISNRWEEINRMLERNKDRRFVNNIRADFFKPDDIPHGKVKLCRATSIELANREMFDDQYRIEKHSDNDRWLRFNVLRTGEGNFFQITESVDGSEINVDTEFWIQEEQYESQVIGRKLKGDKKKEQDGAKVASVIWDKVKPGIAQTDTPINLLNWESFDLIEVPHKDYSDATAAFLLNDDDFYSLNIPAKGWKYYAGNWYPLKKDSRSESADFADLAEGAKGLKRLAVLRMDVDNLGRIFRDGINDGKPGEDGSLKSQAPFSRIVQLSGMMDFFFSGYLNKLYDLRWSVMEGVHAAPADSSAQRLRDAIQIIYAGGDDLCIVGMWNVIPDVALWIHDEFEKFTGGNPDLTLSAGIALFSEKYPLFKVAEIAGEAEGRAKRHPGKNAICFLDHVCSWSSFSQIREHARDFFTWIEVGLNNETLPSSFLHILQELYGEFSNATPMRRLTRELIEKNRYGRWRWLGAYLLHRFGERNKAYREKMKEFATRLFINDDVSSETDFLLILYTASQWADFLTRKKEEDGR